MGPTPLDKEMPCVFRGVFAGVTPCHDPRPAGQVPGPTARCQPTAIDWMPWCWGDRTRLF